MKEQTYWGIKQWRNVLNKRGTINLTTIDYAEQRSKELTQEEDYPLGVGAIMDTDFYERRFMIRR